MVRLFAQLVRLLYFWIITSALVLFWVMRLRLEMDQDQDPSLTIVSQVPIQLRSHNTFLISITPQPVLSLLFNREQAFVTFVSPPPLELPQINWYDSINIGKWQLMGTRFWNFCTDNHSTALTLSVMELKIELQWFLLRQLFFYLHKCLWIC